MCSAEPNLVELCLEHEVTEITVSELNASGCRVGIIEGPIRDTIAPREYPESTELARVHMGQETILFFMSDYRALLFEVLNDWTFEDVAQLILLSLLLLWFLTVYIMSLLPKPRNKDDDDNEEGAAVCWCGLPEIRRMSSQSDSDVDGSHCSSPCYSHQRSASCSSASSSVSDQWTILTGPHSPSKQTSLTPQW